MELMARHNELSRRTFAIALLASFIALLFLHTAIGKIVDHAVFSIQLRRQPLPQWSKPTLVWFLPVMEASIVLLLTIPETRRMGFILSGSLLVAYTAYTALAYGGSFGFVPCACGKIFSRMGWGAHLAVNSVFTLMAASGIYLTGGRFRDPPASVNDEK